MKLNCGGGAFGLHRCDTNRDSSVTPISKLKLYVPGGKEYVGILNENEFPLNVTCDGSLQLKLAILVPFMWYI